MLFSKMLPISDGQDVCYSTLGRNHCLLRIYMYWT